MGKFEDLPLMLTVKMLSEITGEHVDSIRRGIKNGRIPADKFNGKWLISRDAVFPNAKEVSTNGCDASTG